MEKTTPSKADQLLKLDYNEKNEIWLSSQVTLRKLVGILGVLMPLLLFIFLFIDTNYSSLLESISHYYYTRAAGVFVIIISLLAIFLLVYKGHARVDFYVSAIAGIFALLVVLFPTNNISTICPDPENNYYSVTILKASPFRQHFHYVSAGIFLLSLAYMSFFLFTRSDKPAADRTPAKKLRNKIYRFCGVMMVLAILVIFAGFLGCINEPFYTDHHLTFWMETVAVEFFGLSWLIKAEVLLKD